MNKLKQWGHKEMEVMSISPHERVVEDKTTGMLDPATFVDDVTDPFVIIRISVQIEQTEDYPDAQRYENEPRSLWLHVKQYLPDRCEGSSS
jgi:hypothetical protein